MTLENRDQIKYIIRFLLLWIIFQVTAAAEDSCSYEASENSIVTSVLPKSARTRLEGITSSNNCGQACCDASDCSIALFKENICLLINCEVLPGGCKFNKSNQDIILLKVKRGIKVNLVGESQSGDEESEVSHNHSLDASLDIMINETSSITVQSNNRKSGLDSNTDGTTVPPQAELSSVFSSAPLSGSSTISTTQKSTSSVTSPAKKSEVPKTTPAGQIKLKVTTGGNPQIRLPENSVTVHADVTPSQDSLNYIWKLIKNPEDSHATQSGSETDTLKLATLSEGVYQFKVEVHGENSFGEAFVNVTVLPKLRVNKPPVAIISPRFIELTLPTDSTVLDGSKSYDDDGIERYEWEEVAGPLQANINKDENGNFPDEKVLKINGLVVGNYTFKLTVTDTDNISNSTLATIVVKQKIDHPPIANAGSNQVIHMPQNSVVFCGNDSTDDWGIVEYKWSLSPGNKQVVGDMQGARDKCVKLSNLEVGDYTVQLTVTDESGQQDTAKVSVIVQPESNHPPVANAGADQQLLLPIDGGVVTASLDGSKSTDDKMITSVQWKMTGGPESITIVKPNSIKTSITGITKPGQYVMTLTVTDADGDSSSDNVIIAVKEEQPPTALAGPDVTITLPDNVVILDGSESSDDYGIISYEWTRSKESPAAGFALNNSQHHAVLHVAELVAGTYTFTLTVTNVRGKSSEDEVVVTVKPDPLTKNLVELHLRAPISSFKEEHSQTVMKQLEVLLNLPAGYHIIVRNVFSEHGTGHLVVLFYVKKDDGENMLASDVTDSINSKLKHDVDFINFKFLRAETFICQNNCSGHGRCRSGAKECECELFWMENFFRVYFGDGRRNCDWSVMYFGITVFFLITIVSCSVWFITCYCLRKRVDKTPTRRKKTAHGKSRYEKLPMKTRNGHVRKNGYHRPSNGYRSSSIMRSVSSSSSQSDSDGTKENTIFERKRLLANGGGKFNGAFDLDSNPTKTPLRKNSSFARSINQSSHDHLEVGFGHQSTILTVGNSSDENIL